MSEVVEVQSEHDLLAQALDAQDDGEDELYSSIIKKLIYLKPDNQDYYHRLIHAKIKEYKYEDAENISIEAFNKFNESPRFLFDYAFIADLTANWKESIARREHIIESFPIEKFPESTKAIVEMIFALCETGKRRAAKNLIEQKWTDILRNCPHMYTMIGHLEELNLPEKLIEFTIRAKEVYRDNVDQQFSYENVLALAQRSIENRNFISTLPKDLRVISIGQNCLPYSFAARWGFNQFAGNDVDLTIFDFGGFPNETVGEAIKSNFSKIRDKKNLEILIKPGNEQIAKVRDTQILFVHEKGPYFIKDDLEPLHSFLIEKIDNFQRLIQSEYVLLIFCIPGSGNLEILLNDLQALLSRPRCRLLILNVTKNEIFCPVHPNVSYVHIPYPDNYLWNVTHHFSSNRGYEFEGTIANTVSEELKKLTDQEFMPSIVQSAEARLETYNFSERATTPYSRAIGLGFSCSTATLLQNLGLRSVSLPFDWIFSSPSIVAAALTSEFELFLDPRYLRPDANLEKCHHDFFENVLGVPGPIFPHHNPTTPEHRQYFERTVARMRDIMASPEPLFLYAMYQNPIPADHLESFFATLERSFKNFTFLLYNWTHSPDQADQPPVTETIRDRFIIHRQFTRSKMKEGVLFDDETDNIRAREVFLQHYNVPAEPEAAAEPQTPPLPETLTLPAFKKSIIITSLPQGYSIFQLLSSIPTLAAHLNFEFLDNDAITDRFTRIDDQSRTNIAGIIEQTTSFYPGLDRAVAEGQWLWFTFPHVRIDGYFPFAGHDPRFTAPDPAYPTGRAPFTDRIAAAIALAVHESGKPVTDDELFDLYMRATEVELPFAADNILMDFRRIIDHDVRTHVKLLDYIYTNHKTTRMVHAPEALTGTLIGKIASDLLDAMLPNLPVDAERCRAELRYLLTGYEGDASVQTPIHPALARHLGLDWITPDTTYRIFGNRWTFRQAMIHYLRASPWLL